MTSPADQVSKPAFEGGASGSPGGIVALDPFIHRQPHWCGKCGGPQTFVVVYEFASGRVGYCDGCGDEKRVPFSRTIAEVA